jgi:molybdate transport system ATP-binding protein
LVPGGHIVSLDARLVGQVGTLDLDVALEVADDEVVAVIGPNGAGKTTMLRILAGLLRLDTGYVRLDGTLLDDPRADAYVVPERRPIGVVFQDYLLFPHLTARDNVAFGLRARGVARREARRRANEWLDRVGLGDHANSKPRALSGGQAQRVALARALVTTPKLLLLDEPLAALDASTRAEIRRDLRAHLDAFEGVRVIVTHDPIDAATLADRLVVVEGGRVSQTGTVSEVSTHPRSEYVAQLVGLNLYRGVATAGTIAVGDVATLEAGDRQVEGRVFAAVNPRAVALYRDEPHGSPRNRWLGTVTDLDVLADRVRVRLEGDASIVAEITATSADELRVEPGQRLWSVVKATDVKVYAA